MSYDYDYETISNKIELKYNSMFVPFIKADIVYDKLNLRQHLKGFFRVSALLLFH